MPPAPEVQKIRELFIIDDSLYAEQYISNGKATWRTVYKLCDNKIIRKHLNYEMTIGAYNISKENMIKWICFDIEEKTDNELTVIVIYDELVKNGLIPYIEYSGSNDNDEKHQKRYHVWVFLKEQVSAKQGRIFGENIRKKFNIQKMEVNPKQYTREGKLGTSQVKIPLSINRKTGYNNIFVDELFKPIDDQIEFLLNIKLSDVAIINSAVEIKDKPIEDKTIDNLSIDEYIPLLKFCEQEVYNNKIQLKGNGEEGHKFRTYTATDMAVLKIPIDIRIEWFKNQPIKFDLKLTEDHVNTIERKVKENPNIKPIPCSLFKQNCGSIVNSLCPKCNKRYVGVKRNPRHKTKVKPDELIKLIEYIKLHPSNVFCTKSDNGYVLTIETDKEE